MESSKESPPLPARVAQKNYWSDGSHSHPQHRENGVDLAAVAQRLRALPTSDLAMDSLRTHYSDVFGVRKQESNSTRFKVFIRYVDEDEVYITYVPQNTARAVKNSAPKKGNYRYFFQLTDGAYEEIDMQDTKVPVHQKDGGSQCIHCRAFNC